ncbi:protein CGI121 [Xylariomycetidae sp. FL2044]|nr:protein CGI121 [Xylariomycetidae sp. FL2044]
MASPDPTQQPEPSIETIQLEHIPPTHSIQAAVFRDVENAEFLQQQLLSRNADFEYAFIDASSIISRIQVLAAIYKAITIQLSGNMKTPNVHSEIVCSLSPTNNISEAYRRYGITPTSRNIIIVKVLISSPDSSSSPSPNKTLTTPDVVKAHLSTHVRGSLCPFTDATIASFTDWPKVRKYYKLNGVGWIDGIKDEPRKKREWEMLVLGGMALRGL